MRTRWLIFLFLLLSLAFFLPELWKGRGLYYGDNLTVRIPTLSFWKQEVFRGNAPLWNPYILGGIPFLADLSNNALAPSNIVYLSLPVPLALNVLIILYVAAAAIFTFLYANRLTGKQIPALFSAVAFAFSGSLIAAANDINSLQGICLIPLVFYTADRFATSGKLRPAIILVVALTLQFISSHPQYSYYTWVAVLVYLVYFLKKPLPKRLLASLMIFLASVMLSAVQLLPFVELSFEAYRPETLEFASQIQLRLIELPRLILANFYGSWKAGSSWGPGAQLETGLADTEGYVGILPLALAVWGAFGRKSKSQRYWLTAVVITFLLSLGSQTPIFTLARQIMPWFSKFRSPIRLLSLYSFGIAILSGLTLTKIEKKLR